MRGIKISSTRSCDEVTRKTHKILL